MMALALLKNYKPFQAPPSLTLKDIWKKFDKTWALSKNSDKKYGRTNPHRTYEDAMKRRAEDPWNMLFIAGMWFQDLFNYDFRRTEMCIIPYATQQGEISFCAYNTGIGWRKIIENMYKNATVAAVVQDPRQARDLRQGQEGRPRRTTSTRCGLTRKMPRASVTSSTTFRSPPPRKTASAARRPSRKPPRCARFTKNSC